MTHDWDKLSREALILSPDYIKLPHVNLEDITVKEYSVLYGSSDVGSLHDTVYSDLVIDGLSEKYASNVAFAVVEAVQNAQEHAYNWQKNDEKGNLNTITVGSIFTPKYDIIGISSKGHIKIDDIKDLIAKNEHLRYTTRGRGFYIMTKICNVVYPHQDDEHLEIMMIVVKDEFYNQG